MCLSMIFIIKIIYIYSTNGKNRDLKLFLDTPYFELNKAMYDKYSINTWVKNLFL